MPTLADTLQSLGLRHTAAHLDDVVALATKRRWSPTQLLEHLADLELQERTRRSLERRLARSRLGRFTPINWWPARSTRKEVRLMRFTRITVDPRQMGGVPCIRGLRMPVATVVGMVAAGMTVDELLREHPHTRGRRYHRVPAVRG